MTNLASNLVTTAQAHPDKVAIKLDDAELTLSLIHISEPTRQVR